MIKEKNTKRIEYYVVLFLISGLFVFNFYITLKTPIWTGGSVIIKT